MCSVDNSESAFLSEDFPGSRWWYQRQATNSLCAHYALQNGNRTDEAHITHRQTRASKGRMCIIAAGDAKLHHPPSDLQGCDVAQASLFSLQMAEGQKSQYSSALRLAAVSLLSPLLLPLMKILLPCSLALLKSELWFTITVNA